MSTQNERMEIIINQARDAASKAALAANAELPPEADRGFDCGFAGVVVKPARGPLVAWCKKALQDDAYKNHAKLKGRASNEATNKYGHLRDYGGGGWEFWCTGFHNTQSISVHRAAAEAFAKVLVDNGVNATVWSRLD